MKRLVIYMIILITLCSCKAYVPEIVEEEITVYEEEYTENLKEPQSNKGIAVSMRAPKTLNPILNEDVTVDRILKLVFDSLVITDEFQKPIPNLAESFVFSEDGTIVRIKLRDGLIWHDGEKITAYDVEYSINSIRAAGEETIYKKNIYNIDYCSIVDELTIDIAYNSAYGGNSYNLDFPIIPKHYYENSPDSFYPVGSGTYKFEYYEKHKEMGLVANENYFKAAQEGLDKPLIDRVAVYITPNVEAEKTSFEHGIIDVITSNIVDLGKYRGSKEANITNFTTMNYDFIGFNYKNQVFSDVNIRKAIAHLISKDDIIESAYLGHAVPTLLPVNPSSWLYESELAEFNFSAKLAQELIIDSGYVQDEEGILSKAIDNSKYILNFRILVNVENNERTKIAAIIQKNLEAVNIKSEIIEVGFDEYNQKIKNGDFDILIGGYNLSIFPDFTFLLSTSAIQSGTNIFSYSDSEMDMRLSAVRNSRNDQELKSNMKELQRFIVQEVPCISLVFKNSALLTDKNIYGEIMPTVNNVYYNIQRWFVHEEEG